MSARDVCLKCGLFHRDCECKVSDKWPRSLKTLTIKKIITKRPRPFKSKYPTEISTWGTYVNVLDVKFTSKQARKLAAWLIRAADYLDIKSVTSNKRFAAIKKRNAGVRG